MSNLGKDELREKSTQVLTLPRLMQTTNRWRIRGDDDPLFVMVPNESKYLECLSLICSVQPDYLLFMR